MAIQQPQTGCIGKVVVLADRTVDLSGLQAGKGSRHGLPRQQQEQTGDEKKACP